MSKMRQMLEMLAEEDGIHSGQRRTDGQGHLINDPSVDTIDPVSIADTDTEDEFEKEIKKKMEGEAVVKTKATSLGGSNSHIHEFKVGEKRTSTDAGHDHEVIYSNGRPVKIGPGPDDGHIHEL